ncbi:MAG TPA: acetoacetate decarboxylase family protein [Acidimicrobiia bacterium]|nr:acetoacetate decarboxylase family protein [Acidimicrobiia bacterium]
MNRKSRYTIQGHEVTVPVEVRDAGASTASFLVPAAAAQDLIGSSGLDVAEPLPGRAVCSLAFMRYLDGDLGPYHEFAVAFLVRHKGMEPASAVTKSAEVARGFIGAFIHQLPVNQEFTLEAGRCIWGFPKFLADIDLDQTGPVVRAELRHDGDHVLSLSIRRGMTMPARGSGLDAYSLADGVLRRTAWSMQPAGVRGRPGGAELTLGDHPIAKELRGIGLPRRAAFSSTIDHVRMQFQAPDEL